MSGMTIKQALAVIQSEVSYHAGSDTHYRAEKLDQSLATLRAEIDGLRAEVERLGADSRMQAHMMELVQARAERSEARAERLAEALRRYGMHDQTCSAMDIPICTCGLDAALEQENDDA